MSTTNKLFQALTEELESWADQYGCVCGHPACKRCKDTAEAHHLVRQANTMMRGRHDDTR